MPHIRISEAAHVLGISDDTLRRWVDNGRVSAFVDDSGRTVIAGEDLARLMQEHFSADPVMAAPVVAQSARNRFPGIVTRVVRDTVMAQVEIQSGPFRIVSLMSREAADELGLEPGVRTVAAVKSTNVVVEIPEA